jgi:hypothetical protein
MTLTNGLVVMTPTSVAIGGDGAETSTTNADGSVLFSACDTVSLNGVFSSAYDNYMAVIRLSSTANINLQARLRDGVTDATGLNYVGQTVTVDGTSVTASRSASSNYFNVADVYNTQRAGSTIYLFGPYLAQPTAMRYVGAQDYASAALVDRASTHSLSTSYDGLTFLWPIAGVFSGLVTVFGFNQ